MTTPKKHPGGRPKSTGPTKQRHQVMLLPEVADKLRAMADGNLSGGITLAMAMAELHMRNKSARSTPRGD